MRDDFYNTLYIGTINPNSLTKKASVLTEPALPEGGDNG